MCNVAIVNIGSTYDIHQTMSALNAPPSRPPMLQGWIENAVLNSAPAAVPQNTTTAISFKIISDATPERDWFPHYCV